MRKIALNSKELSKHPDDKHVLKQGSFNSDRVYLKSEKERSLFKSLLTEKISLAEFRGKYSD